MTSNMMSSRLPLPTYFPDPALNGRWGVMGVSLSTTVFNKRFFRNFFQWCSGAGLHHVDIILFERLESINFQVFRGMNEPAARFAAKRRGEDLRRMCQ